MQAKLVWGSNIAHMTSYRFLHTVLLFLDNVIFTGPFGIGIDIMNSWWKAHKKLGFEVGTTGFLKHPYSCPNPYGIPHKTCSCQSCSQVSVL